MKMKQYSLLFLGGGFCPTGSWKRSPRKGRGCLQIPPPTKREERLAPPFWPQCSWTRPKVKRWNCPTWRMSVFSPQPWCTFCICKASYNLWSLWSLWVLPYSMIQIFCHISWKSSFHLLELLLPFANEHPQERFVHLYCPPFVQLNYANTFQWVIFREVFSVKAICYLYCSPVVQFGTPGPFHLSHIVLKPTYKYCLTFKCLTTHLQYIDLQYSSRHVFCFCLYSRYLQMCSAIVAELSIHPLNS